VCVLTEVDSSELRSLESDLDEFQYKATRTLFIGNLDKAVTKDILRDTFNKFGHIVVSIAVHVFLCAELSDVATCIFPTLKDS